MFHKMNRKITERSIVFTGNWNLENTNRQREIIAEHAQFIFHNIQSTRDSTHIWEHVESHYCR